MSSPITQGDQSAEILRLLRADLPLTQIERVDQLISLGNVQDVFEELTTSLFSLEHDTQTDLNAWARQGINHVNILEEDYPALLRQVREAPGILYWEGHLAPQELGVSIVGSRNAPENILEATHSLAYSLAKEGIPVISGLAQGIDGAAHSGALEAGGRTVAVVGTGLDRTYPVEHTELRQRITTNHGLIISQFEPGTPIRKFNFPMRNAVMSGYGLATFVMAATEKSGTRHQVKAAVKHGRAVVFSNRVANSVSWANKLVASGKAVVVTSQQEAVDKATSLIENYKSALAFLS